MHLVCLGHEEATSVMRKLLLAWLKGSLNVRLQARKDEILNAQIQSIAKNISWEFSRKPRTVGELLRWQATEFRLFLVHKGPFLQKGMLSKSALNTFYRYTMQFSCYSPRTTYNKEAMPEYF
jgi:hypothetical protein